MTDITLAWFIKYQPTLENYVFESDKHKALIFKWIKQDCIDGNVLLSGLRGCGKSSLARILINNLIRNRNDFYKMKSRSVSEIDELGKWMVREPIASKKKIILFEEMDKISREAFVTLKDGMLEHYQKSTSVIATSNNIEKIEKAVADRFTVLTFTGGGNNIQQFIEFILNEEKISYNKDDLEKYINGIKSIKIRNLINDIQLNSITGSIVFSKMNQLTIDTEDEILSIVIGVFKSLFEIDSDIIKKTILIDPTASVIKDQYLKLLNLIDTKKEIDWLFIYNQLYDQINYIPIKVIISKYIEELDEKKIPGMHFVSFLYSVFLVILEIVELRK